MALETVKTMNVHGAKMSLEKPAASEISLD
jgi:hypothetical protein